MNLRTLLGSVVVLSLAACGGGGGGGGTGSGADVDNGGATPPEPADRFVVSGNTGGTLSILRVNPTAGFATAVGFASLSSGFSVQDMAYDAGNERLVVLTSRALYVVGFDPDTGQVEVLDSADSSSTSNSHLALSADGSLVYVATGTSSDQFIDAYSIDAAGTLTPFNPVASGVDPDYVRLNPAENRLYLVSRTDDTIEIHELLDDGRLLAGPGTYATGENPSALAFNEAGDVAYLVRADNSDDTLQILDVDPTDGTLTARAGTFDVDNALDLRLSADGEHLYVLESSNDRVHHYDVDPATGSLSFVDEHGLGFTPTDLQLSSIGAELYVSHNEEDLVSTLAVDAVDGTLELRGATRVFDGAGAVAAIGGPGALTPTATFLLAPDQTGLNRYAIGPDGGLTLDDKEDGSSALIDGQVAVDYAGGFLFATGENAGQEDLVASYEFDPVAGTTTFLGSFVDTNNAQALFQRIEVGRAGGYVYVLDEDVLDSGPPLQTGFVRAFEYDASGDVDPASIDVEGVGAAPENMRLHPAGRYLYTINSFGDSINWDEVDEDDGRLQSRGLATPGGTGSGEGRPIDIAFHPNGRYAYVSLQDDSEIVRYVVDNDGSLDNLSRFNTATSNGNSDTEPGALAMHPGGGFLFAGERNTDGNILVTAIDPSASYSLSFEQRLPVSGNPTWIEVHPSGETVYVRYTDETIEVFDFDASTGTLTATGQVEDAGDDGGFLGTLTLVAPLQ
jgi:6-phosphogluconolactonase (cycloisomerase 2 family)